MKPADLLRRLNRLATQRNCEITVPRHRGDLKTGTYRAVLKALGIAPSDMEDV